MSLKKTLLAVLLLSPLPCFANLTATAVFEVRTTGVSTNGGCFDPSVTSPGTDFSQQNTAQIAYTDLVIGATNTQLTSAANPFGSTSVGNCIQITGGTGFTVGWYEVLSVTGTTATMDRAVGTAASTGGIGNLGGALADFYQPFASSSLGLGAGNFFWIKAGTYARTASQTLVGTGGTGRFIFTGYNVTRGDNGTHPLFTTSTNSVNMLPASQSTTVFIFNNIDFSNTATTPGTLASGTASYFVFTNSAMTGFSTAVSTSATVINSTISGSTAQAISTNSGNVVLINDVIKSSGSDAYRGTNTLDNLTAIGCVFYANSGFAINQSSSSWRGTMLLLRNSIISNTGGGITIAGFNQSSGVVANLIIQNNVLYGNGTYGVSIPSGSTAANLVFVNSNNAYGANATGARNNLVAGLNDVTLSSDPFVNKSGGNYALNSTAGGGASLRAAGFPGVLYGSSSTTGYIDIGAFQHQDTGGGSTPTNSGYAY